VEIAASWIRAWLAEEVPTPDLKRRLVRLGYEVVETKRLDAGLAPVHLVRVVAREAHPNRSRLSIVTIDTGDTGAGETRVVTGASNDIPGERLWYAPPGATLPALPRGSATA
jgi:tRNA-binding EMAP/Myf-like protein